MRPTKMKVDWPYSEIGQKMANGLMLFCAPGLSPSSFVIIP